MATREITIGTYISEETVLHRFDARLKLLFILTASVLVFIFSGWKLVAFGCFLVFIIVVSRLPFRKILKSIRSVLVILLFTALFQFFLTPGEVIAGWWIFHITDTGLKNGVVFSSRVILLVFLLAILTMTTQPITLSDALAFWLGPFKRLGLNVWKITTVISIALLFVPNIIEQANRIILAQTSRGADFESSNPVRRAKNIFPVIVPVFVKIFRASELLSDAMDSRAYPLKGNRTRFHPFKVEITDILLFASFILASAAIMLIL
ncbi:MAG: energy-coupling factor transporter transmembrane component T [Actinomycetota bacterium]|nr:energy-coupling factor transporter transmembrane component T [Actinomycetota bacterium]